MSAVIIRLADRRTRVAAQAHPDTARVSHAMELFRSLPEHAREGVLQFMRTLARCEGGRQ